MRITKNYSSYYFFILLFLFVLFGCNNPDKISTEKITKDSVDKKTTIPDVILASMNAVAPDSVRKSFQNLVSVADCISPLGKYTTQVNFDSGGYMYFKQVFSYKLEPFEAVLLKDSAWYNLSDTIGVLPSPLRFRVRIHAFHNALLELPKRFDDFENVGLVKIQNQSFQKVKAKDARGNFCAFYFDPANSRLSSWEFINPDRRTDTVLVRFSDWKNTSGYNLPFHVDIRQAGSQFAFNFTKLEINTPEFRRIMLSPSKLSSKKKS